MIPSLFLCDHARQRVRAADDVDMKMIHVLSPDPTRVHDGPEPVRGSLLSRESGGLGHHFPKHRGMLRTHVRERIHVLFRDDHEVHGGHGIDVVEGEHVVVLVYLAARDFAFDDLAEDAIGHGDPFGRDAFSSMPEGPPPRSWSAWTSASGTPCQESITRQWNQRSAVSRTRCSRSPPFEASTTSTASSATLRRISSSPFAYSDATYEDFASAPRRESIVACSRSRMSRSGIGIVRAGDDRIGRDPPPGAARAFEAIEEAAPPARVARDAFHRFDAQQDGVGIAVEAHLQDALRVSRRLT